MNFSEYISMRKIERAKALLTETDLSVAEISRQLNYPEQNSFSRFFKSKVGIPPQTYRSLNTRGALDRRIHRPRTGVGGLRDHGLRSLRLYIRGSVLCLLIPQASVNKTSP